MSRKKTRVDIEDLIPSKIEELCEKRKVIEIGMKELESHIKEKEEEVKELKSLMKGEQTQMNSLNAQIGAYLLIQKQADPDYVPPEDAVRCTTTMQTIPSSPQEVEVVEDLDSISKETSKNKKRKEIPVDDGEEEIIDREETEKMIELFSPRIPTSRSTLWRRKRREGYIKAPPQNAIQFTVIGWKQFWGLLIQVIDSSVSKKITTRALTSNDVHFETVRKSDSEVWIIDKRPSTKRMTFTEITLKITKERIMVNDYLIASNCKEGEDYLKVYFYDTFLRQFFHISITSPPPSGYEAEIIRRLNSIVKLSFE